jgi:hypothetical protein
MKALKA